MAEKEEKREDLKENNQKVEEKGESEKIEMTLEEKIEQLKQERDKYYNNWIKAEAELDNYKKRVQKEKEEFKKYAIENFVKDILVPLDYLEMAITHAKNTQNIDAIIQGVEYTHKCIMDILKNYDITPVTAEGSLFDPTIHEAHEVIETDEVKEGTIVKEHRKGYKICGRLLRAAVVSVAKSPAKEDKKEEEKKEIKENKEE